MHEWALLERHRVACAYPLSAGVDGSSTLKPVDSFQLFALLPLDHTVRLDLHGVALLQRTGVPPVQLERRQAALLAWLMLQGPAARGRLAGLLCPGASGSRALATYVNASDYKDSVELVPLARHHTR